MFTPAKLLEIGVEADAKYRELLQLHPPGTYNEERNDAHRTAQHAVICAEWMERHGIEEIASVGPFRTWTPRNGEVVRVKAGATIFSTAPGTPREGKKSKRATTVAVNWVAQGHINDLSVRRPEDGAVKQSEMHWAGSGGYWRWTDLNNVEPVNAEAAPSPGRP